MQENIAAINSSPFSFARIKTELSRPCSILAIGAIAISTIGSAYLAYSSGGKWFLVTASVGLLNMGSISKLFEKGNTRFGRAALAVSFIVTGSFFAGGVAVFGITWTKMTLISLKAISLDSILNYSFGATALIGYGVPLTRSFLRMAYQISVEDVWKRKLENISLQFRHLNQVRDLGFFSFWKEKFLQVIAIQHPDIVPTLQYVGVSVSSQVRALHSQIFSSSPFEAFSNNLLFIQNIAAEMRQGLVAYSGNYKAEIMRNLKESIESMEEEDFKRAVDLLQENLVHILPQIFTTKQLAELLKGKILDRLKQKLNEFNREISALQDNQMDDYIHEMETELDPIEKDFDTRQPGQEASLQARLDQVNHKFTQKRELFERLIREKRALEAFTSIPQHYFTVLTENNQFDEVLNVIEIVKYSPDLLRKLQDYHLGTLNPLHNNSLGRIYNRIQKLKNKIAIAQNANQQTDSVEAWEFLGSNRCGFVQKDYQELLEWLQIDNLGDIEAKFHELELKTEEDLYVKNILPRNNVPGAANITKLQIKDNLKNYIAERLKPKEDPIRTKVYKTLINLGGAGNHHLRNLSKKVIRVLYQLITKSLILVPVLLYPRASAAGATTGFVYYVLKRFKFLFMNRLDHAIESVRNVSFYNIFVALAFGRSLFSLTEANRNNMEMFAEASLFGRMRILNMEIFATIFIASARLGDPGPLGLGGFIQALALTRELNQLAGT